jgi:hypothetical protein
MKIKTSILDYLGKFENGILVSVGLTIDKEFYNSIFYYTKDKMILNTDDKFLKKWGEIEELDGYFDLMKEIINKVEDYNTIINKLEEYKIEKYKN